MDGYGALPVLEAAEPLPGSDQLVTPVAGELAGDAQEAVALALGFPSGRRRGRRAGGVVSGRSGLAYDITARFRFSRISWRACRGVGSTRSAPCRPRGRIGPEVQPETASSTSSTAAWLYTLPRTGKPLATASFTTTAHSSARVCKTQMPDRQKACDNSLDDTAPRKNGVMFDGKIELQCCFKGPSPTSQKSTLRPGCPSPHRARIARTAQVPSSPINCPRDLATAMAKGPVTIPAMGAADAA